MRRGRATGSRCPSPAGTTCSRSPSAGSPRSTATCAPCCRTSSTSRTCSRCRGKRPDMAPKLDPMVGRYLRTDIDGVPHRLYFEEAGEGIPLVCLHTAGADGRQYRALLNDGEITKRFRVIAFDLPW